MRLGSLQAITVTYLLFGRSPRERSHAEKEEGSSQQDASQ